MVEFFEAIKTIFDVKMDAVFLPFLEANKYTFGFLFGAPVVIAKWRARTRAQIKAAQAEVEGQSDGN